jgi:hypothetical protein
MLRNKKTRLNTAIWLTVVAVVLMAYPVKVSEAASFGAWRPARRD